MKVPLLDLKKQYESIRGEIISAAEEIFDSQQFILGPKVEELENRIADYCGCDFGVGVSSGTDALLISLMAQGVGVGDLVVTTPYTFFATAGAIVRLGAIPVFVDIDSRTYNMDPVKLEECLSGLGDEKRSKIRAIVPIHLYGQCAEMEAILRLARDYGATVIEDAAQAIGAEYRFSNGEVKRAGAMGEYGCFSFFPSKNLGAFGDGGLVTCSDPEVYERLKILRVHGSRPKYHHRVVGGNFRLDAFQAVVLLAKLPYLDQWSRKRGENAEHYRKLFDEAGLEDFVSPSLETSNRHVYNQFVVRVKERRDELKDFLLENDIGCEIYYPVPLHVQECFRSLGYTSRDFPESMNAAAQTLALPVYPELTESQICYVTETIAKFFRS